MPIARRVISALLVAPDAASLVAPDAASLVAPDAASLVAPDAAPAAMIRGPRPPPASPSSRRRRRAAAGTPARAAPHRASRANVAQPQQQRGERIHVSGRKRNPVSPSRKVFGIADAARGDRNAEALRLAHHGLKDSSGQA
jgi:hypothetical protein